MGHMGTPGQTETDIYGHPISPESAPPPSKRHWKEAAGAIGIGAYLLTKLKVFGAIGKFLLPAVKFLKLGKLATTGGSMFVSRWLYATHWGWPFAAGFVVLIFIHEMGHVFVAWRQGVPVSAPIFIPFMGALILQQRAAKTAWAEAWIGYGGPFFGTLGALACWGIYFLTGNALFLGLAFVGFFLNLFNLAPVFPLDGGWIMGAISPWVWVAGTVGLIGAFIGGYVHNPMLIILVVLGIPQAWRALRTGRGILDTEPASREQKIVMAICYVGLVGFLVWAMVAAHIDRPDLHPSSPTRPSQTVLGSAASQGLLNHHELA